MNWMGALLQTYDTCISVESVKFEDPPLIPIFHTTNNAHVTLTITSDGRFISAEPVQKDNQTTTIPCTEDSAGRTSAPAPHPLDDKLCYIANLDRFGVRNSGKRNELYMAQLGEWCECGLASPKVVSVYEYLKSGSVVEDLLRSGILALNDSGELASRTEAPDATLFSIAKIPGSQDDAFVRWSVDDGTMCSDTWNDATVAGSWIEFQKSKNSLTGLCYLTGEEVPLAKNHPKRIRWSSDNAKIISSNDSIGFTYRGRFSDAEQAYGIGLEATQKIHSALRWLIGRQGYHVGNLCIVTWTSNGEKTLNPVKDTYDFAEVEEDCAYTNAEAARHLNSRMRGYNSAILSTNVNIMVLDSAMPDKGRISVSMFREELGEDFIQHLEAWHSGCAWIHRYALKDDGNGKKVRVTFVGAPAPKDIAEAAYGSRADDKLKANTVKRILPCILDGTPIPRDIVDSVVRRASNPVSMEKWEWLKTLSIACSLYKKSKGGVYEMTLEEERRSRDYLYGRLLAMADLMEEAALSKAGETRQTNAVRLMQRFSEFPYSTWRDIELALVPYSARLGKMAGYYNRKIAEIMTMFEGDEFRDNSKLSGEFLLAYHCQREDHFRKKEDKAGETEEE